MALIEQGSKAPAFSGLTDDGSTVSLDDHKGKNIVLYFYPKDMTPGCTAEAEDFRDAIVDFENANTVVIGVSKDSVRRHNNFKIKYDLPFTLISDESGKICEVYGVWQKKKNYGREYMGVVRSTYLIDSKGIVAKAWSNVRVKEHVKNVLEATKALCQ